MNGHRALEILEGFRQGQLAFDAGEIDELIKLGLVVEADPRDLAHLQATEPVVTEYAQTPLGDPSAPTALAARLADIEDKLKSSWSRLTTRDSKVKAQEAERRTLRRTLAILNDQVLLARLVELQGRPLQTGYHPCPALGDEVYALTRKGARVHAQLAVRSARYGSYPLAAFVKQFDKVDAKMAGFGDQLALLERNIGYVKKNPHQVVIGLAKTNLPATEALDVYRSTMRAVHAPDVAVTYARNAAAHGGTAAVAERLRQAQRALRQAGFVESPEVMGAAKTLLPFDDLRAGAERFKAIFNGLVGTNLFPQGAFGPLVKCTARLMPARGTPAEVSQRVARAIHALHQRRTRLYQGDELATATALASMVHDANAIEPMVDRYRQVETELVRLQLLESTKVHAAAIECVAAPGTPVEIADTVRALAYQVANRAGRGQPLATDVLVAASFAKRFAF